MNGWMKYRPKGGIYGRLSFDHHLFFVLTSECLLLGCKDESAAKHNKAEVSLDIRDAAITINQENANQFEVVGNRYHALFTLDNAEEALRWMSYLQLQRSANQGVSPLPNHSKRRPHSQSAGAGHSNRLRETNRHKSEAASLNGELVFDDPLSVRSPASTSGNPDFEWDTEAAATVSNLTIQEETSPVFQLTNELASVKAELEAYRQRVQSYQEVLALRDKQLFEMKDEISSPSHSQVAEELKNLEDQCRSYKEQNSLLNEEILKLHQMYNKTHTLAETQKKRADKLAAELRMFQRNYLAALGSCVYRSLVDPDDGASFVIPEREQHISILKSLARSMKSKNDRILGCSIPSIGKTEHLDTFSFIHFLPNEALQVQYLCNHLHEAYSILIETDEENQKNLAKWKKTIMDSSDSFEITPHLRKLILQGVPSQYRAYLWQKLIFYYVAEQRTKSGEAYYEAILSQQEILKDDKNLAKSMKQISMDVPRTMPNNRDYTAPDSAHRDRLQNVLRAFSIHSPNVGYCQGFNFLAGGCLLFLEEEDAFWFLIAVVEKIFPPNYYRNGLAGLLADQYVLQHIISQQLPKLFEHLTKFSDVDIAAVTTGWFLGLFFDCLPFQTLIRVWDCFLVFGHEAVYRISYAMFKLFESRLLELNELSQLLHAAKNIPKLCIYPAQLIKEAFTCTFPPWEEIEELRSQMEEELIEKHEKKMAERRYYDQRMLLLDEDQDALIGHADDKYSFNCGAARDKIILSASCGISKGSQLYEVEADYMRPLRIPVTDRVTCAYIIIDDVILLGLFCGQLQAYSLSENILRWSMSLSDVVLCITSYDAMICVGTADGKLHFLQINDAETERVCAKKPSLLDSIELSKRATTCCCYIAEEACLWVASGPAIYVVSIGTNETDGFFLVSSRIELVSFMLHWTSYVLISMRESCIIQLHKTDDYSSPPVLVYDVARQMTLPFLYPMIPDEKDPKSPTSSRITSMLLISKGVFWVGTAGGDVTIYVVDSNLEEESPETSIGEKEEKPSNQISIRMVRTQNVSEKAIRCLIKAQSQVVSCSGCYGDEGAVKVWNFEGDFTVAEPNTSESSNSETFEGSLASSSKSLVDADARGLKTDGSADSWKTTMKKIRDTKPKFRKLWNNMVGGPTSQ